MECPGWAALYSTLFGIGGLLDWEALSCALSGLRCAVRDISLHLEVLYDVCSGFLSCLLLFSWGGCRCMGHFQWSGVAVCLIFRPSALYVIS